MPSPYAQGARNAVRTCLNVQANDRVAVICDVGRADIADAIVQEAQRAGAVVACWTMEDWVRRPAREFPATLADQIVAFSPTVSYFIGEGQAGELAFRVPMLDLLARRLRCRHGHMIGIDARLMGDGMAVDYEQVYRVTRQVYDAVRPASEIRVRSPLGTDLSVRLTPRHRWVCCDGRYWEQGQWGNLPEGEVFTAPERVDGMLVAEELGDHFAGRYGLLPEPVRFEIENGRVRQVHGPAPLRQELEAYLTQSPNSDRVGEFAIGTNVGLGSVVGNFLQDEKFPGVHLAFGDPYGAETGADWSAPSHLDALATGTDVWVGTCQVMAAGRILA
jgi:aminopeptidase